MKRTSPKVSYRLYQVGAGMPQPTYLAFVSVENYTAFDQFHADSMAGWKSLTAEEKGVIAKAAEAVIEMEANQFKVEPAQSYVSKETKAKDPEFWSPK